MPPGVWQPAHLLAKIGATLFQVGADVRVVGPSLPEPPAAIAATVAATAATATSANAILRCTRPKLPVGPQLVKRSLALLRPTRLRGYC
jgi:hypothetical protein